MLTEQPFRPYYEATVANQSLVTSSEGRSPPLALLQVLLETGAALPWHFFLQSVLEVKAEGVHSAASFSSSPSARVCMWDTDVCLPLGASHFF